MTGRYRILEPISGEQDLGPVAGWRIVSIKSGGLVSHHKTRREAREAKRDLEKKHEREYAPNMNPIDDAEFGMDP
jgi:hypothetical protein